MKSILFGVVLFAVAYVSLAYTMVGMVESIAYTNRQPKNSNHCYVAINDPSSSRNLYMHLVERDQMCRFVEKCMDLKIPIKVTGDAAVVGANKISIVEYGNSSAKWWTI